MNITHHSRFVIHCFHSMDSDCTKSQAQYHIRELLKCLAHSDDVSCASNDSTVQIDSSESGTDTQEEEQGDLKEKDLQCPLPSCTQLKAFDALKGLQRHFATRILSPLIMTEMPLTTSAHRCLMSRMLLLMQSRLSSSKLIFASSLYQGRKGQEGSKN